MNNKNILLAGSTGLIGSSLAEQFHDRKPVILRRKDFEKEDAAFVKDYENADIIINFAGSPVIRRWTSKARKEMMDSRIETNRKLGLIVQKGLQKKRLFITASGMGIYNDEGRHTENSKEFSQGFMFHLVKNWEDEAFRLEGELTKVAALRTSIVLDRKGGILKKLLPFYRMGLGGSIGNGKQAFSWIHIQDLVNAVEFICERNLGGIFNLASPGATTNREFNRAMSRVLRRPAVLRIPKALLSLIYGKGSTVVSGGQHIIPQRLEMEGFTFRYTDLSTALRDIVN